VGTPAAGEGKRLVVRADVVFGGCAVALACIGVVLLASTEARAASCEQLADQAVVNAAIAQIERSVDPCGESAELGRILHQFRRCAARGVRICTDPRSERNFIERLPTASSGMRSTIMWNPDLRSELERGCDGDVTRAVLRDPVASLLHELVHAVQDCAGLDPADHEFEAVRIENIYRRSRQLCQRTRYGDQLLPAAMRVPCDPGSCRCAPTDRTLVSVPDRVDTADRARENSAGDTRR
jgi:hypothetical protein